MYTLDMNSDSKLVGFSAQNDLYIHPVYITHAASNQF